MKGRKNRVHTIMLIAGEAATIARTDMGLRKTYNLY